MRMRAFGCRLAAASMLAAMLSASAHPADAILVDLDQPVPGHPDLRYHDLAKLVVTDLTPALTGFSGSRVIEVRHIGGPDDQSAAPESFTISSAETVEMNSGGKRLTALLLGLGPVEDSVAEFEALALFDLSAAPRLVDVVDVGYDRFTSFGVPATLALDAGNDMLIATSSHFNSNQSYLTSTLVVIDGGRLEQVESVFTLTERFCAFERQQIPSFLAVPPAGEHAAVSITVNESVVLTGDSCSDDPPPSSSRDISVTYHWDPGKAAYAPDSDALERLEEETSARL